MSESTIQPQGNNQVNQQQLENLFSIITQQAALGAGTGTYQQLYSSVLSQFDRYGINAMMQNHEVVGYTFITRPKLNLSTTSLRQDRILAMLSTADPSSLQFAMRCYLDTNYSSRPDVQGLANISPFFNAQSPFLIPLTNNLVSVSGWPDPVLIEETTEGGFFSEDFTIVKGYDRLNRTYDLSLTFRDIQGGFNMAMIFYWIHYIGLVTRGDVSAYMEDILARRVNYTCSIYRFVLDQSRQFITKWSKATGCFPKSIPIGNTFNFGDRDNYLKATEQFTVQFLANKIEIMDPIIFRDFNTLINRFTGGVNGSLPVSIDTQDPSTNFSGLPYINTIEGLNRFQYLTQAGTPTPPLSGAEQLSQLAAEIGLII